MSGGSPRLQKIPAPRKGSRKKEPEEQQQPEAQLTPRISPLMGKETQPGDLLAYLRMASHALGASMALESGRLYIDELQAALDGVARCLDAVREGDAANGGRAGSRGGATYGRPRAEPNARGAPPPAADAKDDAPGRAPERPRSREEAAPMTQHEAQAIYSSRQTNNINLHAEDGHHFHQEKAVTKYSHAMAQLGYVFDQWFSHRLTQFLAMIFLALLITAAGGLGLWLVGDAKDVQQGTWNAWTYMADPGSHAGVRGTGPQVVAITVTILGVLLMAAILGFIVEAIQAKMEELKSGLSRVVESGHTLILGWTHETVMVIEEICIANESEGGGIIVVLADMHKQEMEMDMAMQLGGHVQARKRLRGTKVVLRSGSPMLVPDLAMQPASRYAHQSEHLNFYELAARVQSYGETLCGYQTRWEKKAHTIINPQDKGEKKLGWEAYDLIVLQGTASAMSAPDPALAAARRASPRSPRGQRGYASSAKMTRGTRSGRHDTIVASRSGTRRASMTGAKKRKEVSSAKLAASRRSLIASHDDGPLAEPGSPKIAPE